MRKEILFYIFFLTSTYCAIAIENYKYFSSEDGLSNSTVSAITADSSGYIWFGTLNGLNRYDGTNIKSFYHNVHDTTSLIGNEIKCLYVDSLSKLWVGTSNGLSLYNESTETFTNFQHSVTDENSLSQNNISKIIGNKHELFISTSTGLNKLSFASNRINRYYSSYLNTKSDEIQDIVLDGSRGIWIAHYSNGLDYFNRIDSSVIHFDAHNQVTNILPSNDIETLFFKSDASLWIGMESGELVRLTRNKNKAYTIDQINYGLPNATIMSIIEANDDVLICTDQHGFSIVSESGYELTNISKGHLLSNDKIWSALVDNSGTLWVGHFRGGVSMSSPNFSHRVNSYSISSELSNAQIITSITGIDNENVLVGTDGVGLFTYNLLTNHTEPVLESLLGNSAVLSLEKVEGEGFLCGTYSNGIFSLDQKLQLKDIYHKNDEIPSHGPSGNDIRGFINESDELWFVEHANYLNKYDKRNGEFIHYSMDFQDSILGNVYPSPWCIERLDSSRFAIGTNRGLFVFNTASNSFISILDSFKDYGLSFSNSIRTLYSLNNDSLLVGSEIGLGLISITKDNYLFEKLSILDNKHICAIEIAKSGEFWISTKSGLCKVNRSLTKELWFDESDGVSSNEFVENSSYRTIEGQLLFGCNKGLVRVKPTSISLNSDRPKIVLSSLFLNYEEEPILGSEILSQSLNLSSELEIPFSYKAVGFSYSSLNFIQGHKNEYAVFLKGFDLKWQEYSKNTSVSYTNLEPGSYTFMVKTRNNDGVESNVKSINITIVPPFYMTTWFQVISLLIIIFALFGIYKARTGQIRKKNELLQNHNLLLSKEIVERKHVEQELILNKEVAESANKAKSEFLANMSHEIRTPLNAVHGFCEILSMTDISQEQNKYVNSIKVASDGLLILINDLLDLSKIESGQIEIKSSPVQLKLFLQEVTAIFELLSKQKGIELELIVDPKLPDVVELDMARLRQVLVNLLGNALKFTHEGRVTVEATLVKQYEDMCDFSIDISDTGIGVEEANLNKIFDSFTQIESSSSRKYEGTGLGLAICKKMVELMNGQIAVSSIIGKGSTFSTFFKSVNVCSHDQLIELKNKQEESVNKRAFIISPMYEHLEILSEILLSISYDVSVFNIDDKAYVESQASDMDIILVFGDDNINDYEVKSFNRVIGVSVDEASELESSLPIFTLPFTTDKLLAVLNTLVGDESTLDTKAPMSENSDVKFINDWVDRVAPYVEVYDTQEIAVLGQELYDKGMEIENSEYLEVGKELLEAVDMFELDKISACVLRIKQLR